jgi:hypothetical protein
MVERLHRAEVETLGSYTVHDLTERIMSAAAQAPAGEAEGQRA